MELLIWIGAALTVAGVGLLAWGFPGDLNRRDLLVLVWLPTVAVAIFNALTMAWFTRRFVKLPDEQKLWMRVLVWPVLADLMCAAAEGVTGGARW